jgi:hypothetical protein
MSQNDENPPGKSAREKLAELVERRKAEAAQAGRRGIPGQRQSEQAAAARSNSKSKPAMRK